MESASGFVESAVVPYGFSGISLCSSFDSYPIRYSFAIHGEVLFIGPRLWARSTAFGNLAHTRVFFSLSAILQNAISRKGTLPFS